MTTHICLTIDYSQVTNTIVLLITTRMYLCDFSYYFLNDFLDIYMTIVQTDYMFQNNAPFLNIEGNGTPPSF